MMELTKEIVAEYVHKYVQEVFEALVVIVIYKLMTSKEPLDYLLILKSGLVIGVITTILESYDSAYKNSLKNGAVASIGVVMLKGA